MKIIVDSTTSAVSNVEFVIECLWNNTSVARAIQRLGLSGAEEICLEKKVAEGV